MIQRGGSYIGFLQIIVPGSATARAAVQGARIDIGARMRGMWR